MGPRRSAAPRRRPHTAPLRQTRRATSARRLGAGGLGEVGCRRAWRRRGPVGAEETGPAGDRRGDVGERGERSGYDEGGGRRLLGRQQTGRRRPLEPEKIQDRG
ncbi:hypothetical protein ABZP36_028995 [Zizania latifolia]